MRTDPPTTLVASFRRRVSTTPQLLAWQHPTPGAPGKWSDLTWREVGQRVRAVSAGLIALGIQPGERVAILSGTRVEWLVAALGTLSAGAAITTIYPSSTPDECAYLLGDAGCVAVFVEDAAQRAKLDAIRARLPALRHVLQLDGTAPDVIPWSDLLRRGREHYAGHAADVDARGDAVSPSDLAALIYTSGTTGEPKGVQISHDNLIATVLGVEQHLPLEPTDKQLMFLPLSHSFGFVVAMTAMHLGAPTAIDGSIDRLVENLASVRPTFLAAVPRVFEKVSAKVAERARAAGPRPFAVYTWAVQVGLEWSRKTRAGQRVGRRLTLKHAVADRLVFRKVRAAFGGRIRAFASGGAPLPIEIAEFFHACGIPVLEGYGLTETTAVSTVNRLEDFVLGTVGQAGDGLELRIAADGEVLLRGRSVFAGYWNKPDATREALDADGWFHTGDVGEVDPRGFLTITDRKKNLIVTAGGKNIAPAKLENALKARAPWVAEVMVVGDKRPYCVALIALDPEGLASVAKHEGISAPAGGLAQDPRVRALLQQQVDAVNATLPKFETIKKFVVLDEVPSLENGELTASLKLKRKVIAARYADAVERMFASGAPPKG